MPSTLSVTFYDGYIHSLQYKAVNPDTHEECRYFRWKPGSRLSKSRSPSFPSSSQLGSPVPNDAQSASLPDEMLSLINSATPPVQPLAAAAAAKPWCPVGTCRSTRICIDCRRRFCKTHCLSVGGCISPPHFVTETTACREPLATIDQPSQQPVASQQLFDLPSAPLPFIHTIPPIASTSGISIAATTSQSAVPPLPFTGDLLPISSEPTANISTFTHSIDARPNPRYVSHMPPIFTEQYEQEQLLREKQWKLDLTRLDSLHKSKHTIILYAWLEVRVLLMVESTTITCFCRTMASLLLSNCKMVLHESPPTKH